MTEFGATERGVIAFAERLLQLFDEGRFTATYKYAVLLALIDLCIEHSTRTGGAPEMLTTRQLAEKIVDLYWPHTAPFAGQSGTLVLTQNSGGQAEILTRILRFRQAFAADPSATLAHARAATPRRFEQLVRHTEWKLIEMPLPRLQLVGDTEVNVLYRIGWDRSVRRADVDAEDFDNRIHLLNRAGEYLVQLTGLLRPLIQRHWAGMVARLNRQAVGDSRLEEFLFGAPRIGVEPVRQHLRELQNNRCFYCERQLAGPNEVDHFLPWARYPDNGIENLVVADPTCNNSKRDFLAAAGHVVRWVERFNSAQPEAAQLSEIAERTGWDQHPDRTLSVARVIYLRLPGNAKLWFRRREFVDVDRPTLLKALATS